MQTAGLQRSMRVKIHDTALTQEQLEAMGWQSVCGSDVGDEATTFL
jgi:hypothetical protein